MSTTLRVDIANSVYKLDILDKILVTVVKRFHEFREALDGNRPSDRADRSELEHDDGDRDSPDTAGQRRRFPVHLPLQPYAHEAGHEGGTGGDGRRFRSLRDRTLGRARRRHWLRLPRRDHEYGQGLPSP